MRAGCPGLLDGSLRHGLPLPVMTVAVPARSSRYRRKSSRCGRNWCDVSAPRASTPLASARRLVGVTAGVRQGVGGEQSSGIAGVRARRCSIVRGGVKRSSSS